MTPDPQTLYVAEVLREYRDLPDTSHRIRPADRHLARGLYAAGVPLYLVRSALMLATVRRATRPADEPPLSPIRSLAYFRPVIDELVALPPDPGWIAHVTRHFIRIRGTGKPSATSLSSGSRPTGSCLDSRVSS